MTYLNDIDISAIDTINDHLIDEFYRAEVLQNILSKALTYIDERVKDGLTLPYFADIDAIWVVIITTKWTSMPYCYCQRY